MPIFIRILCACLCSRGFFQGPKVALPFHRHIYVRGLILSSERVRLKPAMLRFSSLQLWVRTLYCKVNSTGPNHLVNCTRLESCGLIVPLIHRLTTSRKPILSVVWSLYPEGVVSASGFYSFEMEHWSHSTLISNLG